MALGSGRPAATASASQAENCSTGSAASMASSSIVAISVWGGCSSVSTGIDPHTGVSPGRGGLALVAGPGGAHHDPQRYPEVANTLLNNSGTWRVPVGRGRLAQSPWPV